jgi:peroxiredoxin
MLRSLAVGALCFGAGVEAIRVGDRVPSIDLDYGFPPEKINLADRVAGKNVIVVSLPGAFTPT